MTRDSLAHLLTTALPSGRHRIGTFDRAAFEHEIREEATGARIVVITPSWIVPRRSAA